jgi:hypothetical protein
MDTLTIDKALELHRIIGKHIPELDENEDALQFIGKIVNSIQDSNSHRDYTDAVVLMDGRDWDEIKLLDSSVILELFIEGLSVNKIIELKSFCDSDA